MYLTISLWSVVALLILVFCAIVCVGVLISRSKRLSSKNRSVQDRLDSTLRDLDFREKELLTTRRDLRQALDDLKDANGHIRTLRDDLAARNKEIDRLQKLVAATEKNESAAREQCDKETNRANTADVSRFNTETQLFAARHGEDPETESFYSAKYPPVFEVLPAVAATVTPEPVSGAAAEPAAEEATPAEAPKGTKKKPTRR